MRGNQDAELQRKVRSELRWHPAIDDSKIRLSVERGIVTLYGHVHSLRERNDAQRIASSIGGVAGVRNDLAVKLTIGDSRTDTALKRIVQDILEWSSAVRSGKIDVSVAGGCVVLGGEVEWGYQKRAAEDAVSCLIGIQSIDNQLLVKPRSHPTRLRSRIEAAFRRYGRPKDIRLEIDGERVVVSGVAGTCAERDEAIAIAWSGPGVSSVEDRIVVRPQRAAVTSVHASGDVRPRARLRRRHERTS